jgi:hypothetical protein
VREAAVAATATVAGVIPPDLPGRPSLAPTVFPDAGLVLLKGHVGEDEVWCRFDSGPFGYLTIAAHAHADALALEVRVAGVDVVADPGNSSYEAEPDWRRYFRSTRAHATAEVGGHDQAEQWGAFLWAAHADADLVRLALDDDGRRSATGRHGAYRRLSPPVDHERTVTLDERAGTLGITDVLSPGGAPAGAEVDVVLSFPLGPTVEVTWDGTTAHLTWPGRDGRPRGADLELPDVLTWSALRGRHDPPSGWYSPEFGVRVPAWSLQGSGRVKGPIVMVSVLRFTR